PDGEPGRAREAARETERRASAAVRRPAAAAEGGDREDRGTDQEAPRGDAEARGRQAGDRAAAARPTGPGGRGPGLDDERAGAGTAAPPPDRCPAPGRIPAAELTGGSDCRARAGPGPVVRLNRPGPRAQRGIPYHSRTYDDFEKLHS